MSKSKKEMVVILLVAVVFFTAVATALLSYINGMPVLHITLLFLLVSLCLGAAAFCAFLWAVRYRQFQNMEGIGRRMIDYD